MNTRAGAGSYADWCDVPERPVAEAEGAITIKDDSDHLPWSDFTPGWLSRIPAEAYAALIEADRREHPDATCPTCYSTRPMEPVLMKQCPKCPLPLLRSAFYKAAGRHGGLTSLCRVHERQRVKRNQARRVALGGAS